MRKNYYILCSLLILMLVCITALANPNLSQPIARYLFLSSKNMIIISSQDIQCANISKSTLSRINHKFSVNFLLNDKAANKLRRLSRKNIGKLLVIASDKNRLIFAIIERDDRKKLKTSNPDILSITTIQSPMGKRFEITGLSKHAIRNIMDELALSRRRDAR